MMVFAMLHVTQYLLTECSDSAIKEVYTDKQNAELLTLKSRELPVVVKSSTPNFLSVPNEPALVTVDW